MNDTQVFQQYIGKKWNVEVNEEELRSVQTFNLIRVINPDTMVTMDYQEDRLNVNLDVNDVITSIYYS